MDLTGLAGLTTSIGPGYQAGRWNIAAADLEELRVQEAREQLRQQQIEQQGQDLLGSILPELLSGAIPGATPIPPGVTAQAQPQPPAPVQPIQPMQVAMRQGDDTAMPPGLTPSPAPRPPMASPAPQVAAGGPPPIPSSPMVPPTTPPVGPPGAGTGFNAAGGVDIPTLAKMILKKNPGVDNRALLSAVRQGAALLLPEARQNLQVMLAEFRQATAQQKNELTLLLKEADITSREGIAQLKLDFARTLQGSRDARADKRTSQQLDKALAMHGIPPMPGASDEEKLDALAGERRAEIDTKQDPDLLAFNEATKAANALNADLAKTMPGGIPPEPGSAQRPEFERIMREKNARRAEAEAAYKRLRAKGGAKSYDDMEKAAVEEAPTDTRTWAERNMPTALGGKPKPLSPDVLKALPDPKGHAEGSKAKDSTGNVVAVIKNGAWVAP